jgi:hypothetical protein
MDQKQLRALVARMQEHVTLAASPTASETNRRDLSTSWNALLSHLNVEPAPEVRGCPGCGREIMRAATLCGYCWTKSTDSTRHA